MRMYRERERKKEKKRKLAVLCTGATVLLSPTQMKIWLQLPINPRILLGDTSARYPGVNTLINPIPSPQTNRPISRDWEVAAIAQRTEPTRNGPQDTAMARRGPRAFDSELALAALSISCALIEKLSQTTTISPLFKPHPQQHTCSDDRPDERNRRQQCPNGFQRKV